MVHVYVNAIPCIADGDGCGVVIYGPIDGKWVWSPIVEAAKMETKLFCGSKINTSWS